MNSTSPAALAPDFAIDYIELSVADLDASVTQWAELYGFTVTARAGSLGHDYRKAALRQGDAALVLSQGVTEEHPARAYVTAHGDGISDIAMRTGDVEAAFDRAIRNGARPLSAPDLRGGVVCATVSAWGDVAHTLVQYPVGQSGDLPGGFETMELAATASEDDPQLQNIDHIAVCVVPGELDQITEYYERCFGFEETFEEHIVVGAQAMNSKVVQSTSRKVTFTILEPDVRAQPGQIDQFIKDHDGPGVQHIAFAVDDAVLAVRRLTDRGVEFLSTPGAYYDALSERITPIGHTVAELRERNVLIDQDHGGQLFQIFTRSTHERGTLFFEIIERFGATSFGSANIKALYEAVEIERSRGTRDDR